MIAKQKNKKTKKTVLKRKVPYQKKPADMTIEQWQTALRRQFAEQNKFVISNLDGRRIFSDFKVFNPVTNNSYRVAIRSLDNTANFCSCFDFKTNNLGTCKHIEAVFLQLRRQRGFKKHAREGYVPAHSSIYLKYSDTREIRLRIGSNPTPQFLRLAKKYFHENLVLREEAFDRFEEVIEEARKIDSSFKCYPDALEYIIDIRQANKRKAIIDKIVNSGNWEEYLKSLVKVEPFPFQSEGIRFACVAGKSINADEMGLGKTFQAIAAAEVMRKEFKIAKVLIITPTSLKYQWESEIRRFTGSVPLVIEGHPLRRAAQYEQDVFYKIVSYSVVRYDVNIINAFSPDLVIIDEAQRIKNWNTKIALNVKKIRSPYTLALTGTPLENKLEELVSVTQYVDPFRIGPLYRFLEKHQVKDESGKVIGYKALKDIGTLLSDILIRRQKKQVLAQLPERTDKNLFVSMTKRQTELHTEFADVVARLVYKWRKMGFLNESDRQRLMINLNMMRMVCDSTYILDQETREDTKIEELMCILDEVFQIEGMKVVVFSQWERMTRLVSEELKARKVNFEYLHGGVPSKDRGQLLTNFRDDASSRVFLSTDAGGVGLNLQSASLLINLDIPWNPAVLEQRIGRIYRYGQKQNVSIINLVATGTIEHKMLDVLKFKSSVFEGILDDGEDNVFMGESRFNEFMKSVDSILSQDTVKPEIETTGAEQGISREEKTAKEKPDLSHIASIIPGDDDIPEKAHRDEDAGSRAENDVTELITSGIGFINKFSQIISDEKAAEHLLNRFVERDGQTGKSYIKIPIENQEIIGKAIKLFTGLAGMFRGN